MLVVVDSGSTKADWLCRSDNGEVFSYSTQGFNPFFHDADFVFHTLSNHTGLSTIASRVSHLYFYGAGCSSPSRNEIIKAGLSRFFTRAMVVVEHDLLGSARATCGAEAGISCILGTGSNCCAWTGKELVEGNFGLGFILGDEGSGSWYGRKLVTAYLYKMMPPAVHENFGRTYGIDKESAIQHVYHQPGANVWLASFAVFLTEHSDEAWIDQLVRHGQREFLTSCLAGFKAHKNLPFHFIGSLAYAFQKALREECSDLGIQAGTILHKPISAMMDYHLKYTV